MKAYYNQWLQLPKKRFNIPSLKNALTYPLRSRDRITGYIRAYQEDDDYFSVPREFFTEDRLKQLNVELEYQIPTKYKKTSFKDGILLDALDPKKMTQRKAFAAMKNHMHGVLSLACGKGKTILALKYIAHLRRPALVIVETTTLVNQWGEQAEKFLGLKSGQIGLIQGHPSSWTTNRPLVLATIQSLARHVSDVDRGIRERFGIVVWDECHHLSAPHYSKTAALFPGIRLGLSATPNRLDGLENLYFSHIGDVFYLDHSQDLVPTVKFHEVNLGVDWNATKVLDEILDRTGELSWTRLWGFLGENQKYLDQATDLILADVKKGRKILVLSNRLNTVKRVNEGLNTAQSGVSDVITGKTTQDTRLQILRDKQVTVASTRIAREGIDEPSLDTLFVMEPFSDPYTLRQTVGRILRSCATKKQPHVHVMVARYEPCRKMMFAMRRNFMSWNPKPNVEIESV